jgi:glutaminyl-peptide cyclotransferase
MENFFNGHGEMNLPPAPAPPAGAPAPGQDASFARKLSYRLVKIYPHQRDAFTEGLFWEGGVLYESVGLEGQSQVRKVDLKSGKVLQSTASPDKVFGEGLALVGGWLFQLTYTEGRALVYDAATLRLLGEFQYAGEGWGLTTDGRDLIMSDGTDTLTYRSAADFKEVRKVRVTLDGKPVKNLNELEYVEGRIWANIWKKDRILRIDAATGRVTGVLDLTGLRVRAADLPEPEEDVLNGIAYDPATGHFLVTGKCWPSVFEIEIKE